MTSSLAGFGVREGTGREVIEQVALGLILGPLVEFQFGCILIFLNHLCATRHFSPVCLPSLLGPQFLLGIAQGIDHRGDGTPGGHGARSRHVAPLSRGNQREPQVHWL